MIVIPIRKGFTPVRVFGNRTSNGFIILPTKKKTPQPPTTQPTKEIK